MQSHGNSLVKNDQNTITKTSITIEQTFRNLCQEMFVQTIHHGYRDHIYVCPQEIPNEAKGHNFVAAILEEQDSEVKHSNSQTS